VSGKEDRHDMAKTTRKTETAAAEAKPARARKKADETAAGAGKAPARAKRKTAAKGSEIPVASASAIANLGQPVQAPSVPPEPTHNEIALRAWSIYQRRGASHGQAMSDWLQAKAELSRERGLVP
jgi:hypothetical protein